MMKTKMRILAVVALMIAATGSMMAQTADATANILDALGCTNAAGDAGDLDFGDIVPGTVESTVTIASDALGERTLPTGDAVLVGSDEGGSAQFDLVGLADAVVDLTVDANVTLTEPGLQTMTATLALSAATATLTGSAATFYVGGTLTVAASQAVGAYAGTFDVVASYQ